MTCHCDECFSAAEPETPDRFGPVSISARKVTVFQVNGKGKRWSNRAAAYRAAARKIVWNACLREHDAGHHSLIPDGETCRYCSKECDGRADRKHHFPTHWDPSHDATDFECNDPEHAYRYRLMVRLTRWLKWRDSRLEASK